MNYSTEGTLPDIVWFTLNNDVSQGMTTSPQALGSSV
jgi:hypothetical protein